MSDRIYPDVDSIALGEFYTRHVAAMTAEGLHSKAGIAAQLAWRDKQVAELQSALAAERAAKERAEAALSSAMGYVSALRRALSAATPVVVGAPCAHCDGEGHVKGGDEDCVVCGGEGIVYPTEKNAPTISAVEQWERTCPYCGAMTNHPSIDGGLARQYHGECEHSWDINLWGKCKHGTREILDEGTRREVPDEESESATPAPAPLAHGCGCRAIVEAEAERVSRTPDASSPSGFVSTCWLIADALNRAAAKLPASPQPAEVAPKLDAHTLRWAADYLDGWQNKPNATAAYLAAYEEVLTRLRAAAGRVERGEPGASRNPVVGAPQPAEVVGLREENER